MRAEPVWDEADMRDAEKKMRDVDARSIKKVAEAKWRKKKRADAKMAAARKR